MGGLPWPDDRPAGPPWRGRITDHTPGLTPTGLGERYRRRWALHDVDLSIPARPGRPQRTRQDDPAAPGRRLLAPDTGQLRVLDRRPGPASVADTGFVAQDKPLYRDFPVRDLARLGGGSTPPGRRMRVAPPGHLRHRPRPSRGPPLRRSAGPATAAATARPGPLTQRERPVLGLIAHGRSSAEITTKLFLGEATVKTHIGRILTRLDLRDRAQAVIAAHGSGLVRPGEPAD